MLAIFISWLCIFTVFITSGHIITSVYEKIAGHREKYGVTDTFITGMCITSVLLCILSLFFAVDHYILSALLAGSLLYWCFSFRCLSKIVKEIKYNLFNNNKLLLLACFLLGIGFLLFPVWTFSVKLDPFIYHYNNVMWNETYPVVKGLANLDEKFGFNSAYFLLQSCFSLRFLFGETIVGVQSLLAFTIAAHYLYGIVKSNFDLKNIGLFLIYFILIFVVRNDLTEPSTDIIPTLVIFYLFSKIIISADSIKTDTLFYVLIPVVIMTFKLSSSLVLFVSIWAIYILIRNRDYKAVTSIIALSVIILIPWLIRNVMLSGYLVFPLYELDLFSVDWKVPVEIVKLQKDFIHDYATHKALVIIYTFDIKNETLLLLIACSIAILACIYHIIRKRESDKIIIFSVLIVNILFWALSAPDIRFGYGYIFAMIFLGVYFSLPYKLSIRKNLCIVFLFLFSAVWGFYGYRWASKYASFLSNYAYTSVEGWKEVLTAPVRLEFLMDRELKREDERFNKEKEFVFIPHKLNNDIPIFISSSRLGFTFEEIPAMSDCRINSESVFHDFRKVEARGKLIEDGFRHKQQ